MITKQFKQFMAVLLQANNDSLAGLLPCKNYDGTTVYVSPYIYNTFPKEASKTVRFNPVMPGILVGSGSTPATEDDYALEAIIDSGLSASSTTRTLSLDESGNPVLTMTFTLTNTESYSITVSEIGYCQTIFCSTTQNANSNTMPLYIDRTVLSNPVTIAAGDSATIKYQLKTIVPSD